MTRVYDKHVYLFFSMFQLRTYLVDKDLKHAT